MIFLYVIVVLYLLVGLWLACSKGMEWWLRPQIVVIWLPLIIIGMILESRKARRP